MAGLNLYCHIKNKNNNLKTNKLSNTEAQLVMGAYMQFTSKWLALLDLEVGQNENESAHLGSNIVGVEILDPETHNQASKKNKTKGKGRRRK